MSARISCFLTPLIGTFERSASDSFTDHQQQELFAYLMYSVYCSSRVVGWGGHGTVSVTVLGGSRKGAAEKMDQGPHKQILRNIFPDKNTYRKS